MKYIRRQLAAALKKCSNNTALSKIGQNVGWLLAGKGLGALLSIIYLGLATRTLGPADFGRFALIVGLAQTITGVVAFQTWRLVVLYGHSTGVISDESHGNVNDIVIFGLKLDVIAAITGCGVAIGGVSLLQKPMEWSDAVSHMALAFSIIMLLCIRSTAVGTLRLYDRFRHGAGADAIMPITRMGGAIAATIFMPTVAGFLGAWALSEITTTIAYWLAVYRYTPARLTGGNGINMRKMISAHPGIMRFAIVTNAGSTLSALVQNLPLLAIGIYAGPALSGLYRLANQLAQALMRVADMLNRSIYPELAKVISNKGHAAAHDIVRKTTLMAIGGGSIIILITVFFGKTAINMIAGPAFLESYSLLVILGIASSLELAGVALEPMLVASGEAGKMLLVRLFSAMILILALALLLPSLGATGAAWATLLVTLFSLTLATYLLRQINLGKSDLVDS